MSDNTPLLNAPTYSGIRVPSGGVTTIQVAMLPHEAPWRLQLYYDHESCTDSFLGKLKRLPKSLLAMAVGQPIQAEMHTIESELIEQ